ncbi:MAG: phosphoribosylamine--glycine ligase [Bacteroidetes bacterium]|nr:phosphoribosylamine--glycine ligase [Bacteroidota bacterium]MDA1332984.1 phosphoribosylamine--glycine ligase [Bacteroidota bacterium]
MRILIIGSGGREHAIAWSLKQSPQPTELFIAPGNGGTQALGRNVSFDVTRHEEVIGFVRRESIDFVIVGPEQPLVDGLSDALRKESIPVVGPSAAAAQLEGSKAFSKSFMSRHGIPTAAYRTFSSDQSDEALDFVREEGAPIVVKASGLAAGKGAMVCMTLAEAENAVRGLMKDDMLGDAGSTVVIESFMTGEEASLFVLTDGVDFSILAPAQDHKRIGEGDIGPNTGGMGAYAPAPVMTTDLMNAAIERVIRPTLEGMVNEGMPYQGILYVGLMITEEGPKVVEYNCRLGDPEAQVVLPLMKTDAVDVFAALAHGTLSGLEVESYEGAAACVVLASAGYPGSYEKGKAISGIGEMSDSNGSSSAGGEAAVIFHAGTRVSESGELQTNGGRVLAVAARGVTLQVALDEAYRTVSQIDFDGVQFRRDIGHKGLAHND